MNKVVLIGRLARDPEVRYSQNDTSMAIARFSLAVDRRRSANNQDGQSADFISCVAFGRTAEFIEKYFTKGRRIGVYGHIQTTDVVVDEAEFVESRGDNTASDSGFTAPSQNQAAPAGDGFMNIPDGIDEDLPFN